MGKNNRQRRAAKAKQRRAQRRQHTRRDQQPQPGSSRQHDWAHDPWITPGDQFVLAVRVAQEGDEALAARLVDALAAAPRTNAAKVVAGHLEEQIGALWEHGWQPVDLDRLVGRELNRGSIELVRAVIAAQATGYAELAGRVAPEWMDQLERIEAVRPPDGDRHYLLRLTDEWREIVGAAVASMALLTRLPALPQLVDPPSRWHDGSRQAAGRLPPSVLDKVRALLAKAESTSFDAEADAFTAKAQELMARHRIDRAVLESQGQADGEQPIGRRIGVDDPYAEAKAMLLGVIADANGARAVWSKELGFSTVFGFPGELAATEELFTSLLVQSSVALRRQGSKQDRFGRSRTTRYRRSFLVAFANRIGQRLRETVEATVETASAETGTALVPLLAARDEAATQAAEAAFPDRSSFSPTASDGEGWYAGTLFGDQADLGLGPPLPEQSDVA